MPTDIPAAAVPAVPGRRDLILQLLRTSTEARSIAQHGRRNGSAPEHDPLPPRRAGAHRTRRASIRRNHRPRPATGLVPGQPPDGPGRTDELPAAREHPDQLSCRHSHRSRSRTGSLVGPVSGRWPSKARVHRPRPNPSPT